MKPAREREIPRLAPAAGDDEERRRWDGVKGAFAPSDATGGPAVPAAAVFAQRRHTGHQAPVRGTRGRPFPPPRSSTELRSGFQAEKRSIESRDSGGCGWMPRFPAWKPPRSPEGVVERRLWRKSGRVIELPPLGLKNKSKPVKVTQPPPPLAGLAQRGWQPGSEQERFILGEGMSFRY